MQNRRADELRWILADSVDGWPAVHTDGWDTLRARYLYSIEKAQRLAAESESLTNSLLPSDVTGPTESGFER